jgi:hypothetical protein
MQLAAAEQRPLVARLYQPWLVREARVNPRLSQVRLSHTHLVEVAVQLAVGPQAVVVRAAAGVLPVEPVRLARQTAVVAAAEVAMRDPDLLAVQEDLASSYCDISADTPSHFPLD